MTNKVIFIGKLLKYQRVKSYVIHGIDHPWLTKRGKGGAEQVAYKEMRQEISNIETNIGEVLQMYGQRMRTRAGQAGSRMEEEGEKLSQE